MAKTKKPGSQEDNSKASITIAKIGIFTAGIAVVGVIATALFNYLGAVKQVELPIKSTQTAEVRLTQAVAQAATPVVDMPQPTSTQVISKTASTTFVTQPVITMTDTPAPLASITNFTDNDYVPRFISLMGEYRPELTENIWIFVQDPNKLYYPQSMNPCIGESTPKVNGDWEIHIGVGVDNSSGVFNLVLASADPQADHFIASSLVNGCSSGNFPSYPELPSGVTEHQRIAVNRTVITNPEDSYGPAPALTKAELPGQVTVDNFGTGDEVRPEEVISGTVSGSGEELTVWMLVYTHYGRWYPQSFDPCKGIHTQKSQGVWKTKAIFGGDDDTGKPFDVVVVLADPEANEFFDTKQREWCQAKHYPGLLTIDLPDGIDEKSRLRVIRN